MLLAGILLLGLISSLSAFAGTGSVSASEPVVLVTAFEPFEGRRTNGSQVLAQELARRYQGKGVRYEICVLPVEFEKAAEKAKECYRRLPRKPAMVISTGEGPSCEIQIETRARNRRKIEDRSEGRPATLAPIEAGASRFERFTFPIPAMYCSGLAARNTNVSRFLSSDAGDFVCNETSYRLNSFFRREAVPYGFIHVPLDGTNCGERRGPSYRTRFGEQLHRMVSGAMRENANSLPALAMDAARNCRNGDGVPVSDAQEVMGEVSRALNRNCEREVARYLSEEMENDRQDSQDLWPREFQGRRVEPDEEEVQESGDPSPPKSPEIPGRAAK